MVWQWCRSSGHVILSCDIPSFWGWCGSPSSTWEDCSTAVHWWHHHCSDLSPDSPLQKKKITVKWHFCVCDKLCGFTKNGPLDKFMQFLFTFVCMRSSVLCYVTYGAIKIKIHIVLIMTGVKSFHILKTYWADIPHVILVRTLIWCVRKALSFVFLPLTEIVVSFECLRR